jgi:hypothetical protein
LDEFTKRLKLNRLYLRWGVVHQYQYWWYVILLVNFKKKLLVRLSAIFKKLKDPYRITITPQKYHPKESNFRIMGNEPILRPPKRLDKMFTGLSPPLANIQKIQQEVKTIGFFFSLITTYPQ